MAHLTVDEFCRVTAALTQQVGEALTDKVVADLTAAPLKDHQIAQLVNNLTTIARTYHGTQQLRQRISQCVCEALQVAAPATGVNGPCWPFPS